MKFQQFLPVWLGVVASIVSATPANSPATVTAKYDDLPTAVAVAPVGTYSGLVYTNWNYDTVLAVQVGGVTSQSSPNRLISGLTGTPTFTVQSPPYKAFTLDDFYLGCTLKDAQGVATLATTCTITVTSYLASNGAAVAPNTFTFTPPAKLLTPVAMQHAVLPSQFQQKLSKVTIAQPNALVVTLADNVRYNLYTS